ncbi:transposable element Tcb1 transposase [Trichonephila clavipes]|nr:transposable element Tcb1 transposase [Trichonephila clavipes]
MVEAMRPLEDTCQNWWTMADFSVRMQDNAKPHTTRVTMNCLTVNQTLPWPARSPDPSPIEHVWDMRGRRLYLPGNVDDLTRQLEQIWQNIP